MLRKFVALRVNANYFPSLKLNYAKMPKPKKNKNPSKPADDKTVIAGPVTVGPVRGNNDHIKITILAKPGAKQNAVTDFSSEGIGVQIAAPPREGEANAELCLYIASILDVKKSTVSIDKGSKSRNKTVEIQGTKLTVDEVTKKLKKELENG